MSLSPSSAVVNFLQIFMGQPAPQTKLLLPSGAIYISAFSYKLQEWDFLHEFQEWDVLHELQEWDALRGRGMGFLTSSRNGIS